MRIGRCQVSARAFSAARKSKEWRRSDATLKSVTGHNADTPTGITQRRHAKRVTDFVRCKSPVAKRAATWDWIFICAHICPSGNPQIDKRRADLATKKDKTD